MLGFFVGLLVGALIGAGGLLTAQWLADIEDAGNGKPSRSLYDNGWADGYQVANNQHREKRTKAGLKAAQTRRTKAREEVA